MADYIVSEAGGNAYHITEHYHKCVLAGDPASVRERLTDALELLGYDIIDDESNIIRGRRGPRGWAPAFASADVLDYPRTLIVKLKPHGSHATRATFDYVIKHPSLNRGEIAILTREAEALSSLATLRSVEKMCPACGTDATDDSRFCRQCGSPMSVRNNELELLMMAAEVRAGYTSVVATSVVLAVSTLLLGITLIAMLASGVPLGSPFTTLLVIGISLSLINVFFSGFGWNRVSRALKLKQDQTPATKLADRRNIPEISSPTRPFAAGELGVPASVTESTTNLLHDDRRSVVTGSFEKDGQ